MQKRTKNYNRPLYFTFSLNSIINYEQTGDWEYDQEPNK